MFARGGIRTLYHVLPVWVFFRHLPVPSRTSASYFLLATLSMTRLPENPYRLTVDDLVAVKKHLASIVADEKVHARQRIDAARTLAGMLDQVMKYREEDEAFEEYQILEEPEKQTPADPLKGFKLIAS